MKLYITDINEIGFVQFSQALDEVESDSELTKVEVILNSQGGSAVDALAFYERIKASPNDINITVYGCCYSAAVLVLAAGDYRKMTKTAWLMVHEDAVSVKNEKTSSLEVEANQMRRMENQWNFLLAERSSLTAYEWECMHKATTYMNAKECLEAGIIEEII